MEEQDHKTEEEATEFWRRHYDELASRQSRRLFRAESKDYFDRLMLERPLSGEERVLDFGCGFGFITRMLAGNVRRLGFWDNSSQMLAQTADSLSACDHAFVIDLTHPAKDPQQTFDLIVVNSVIQYMSVHELSAWLNRWRDMLAADGSILISDIILPKSAIFKEARDSLRFAAREGFLWSMLWHDSGQILRYLLTRNQAPMMRYTKDEFADIATSSGLEPDFLPNNLTYRSIRFSVSLKRAGNVSSDNRA